MFINSLLTNNSGTNQIITFDDLLPAAPFIYQVWPLIVGIILVIMVLGFLIYKMIKEVRLKQKDDLTLELKLVDAKSLAEIKQIYLKRLEKLEQEIRENQIATRGAYQKLSSILRTFAYEATGIKIQNFSLSEIRGTGYQNLVTLVSEYYDPEFAKNSQGDLSGAIKRTKEVISKW